MIRTTTLVAFLLFTFSCEHQAARYRAGDCFQNPKDGFVWRITSVRFGKYTVQGWFEGKWGIPVEVDNDTFLLEYVKIACPFSAETSLEQKQ